MTIGDFDTAQLLPVVLNPKQCPRCGRAAHFYYLNQEAAEKQLPLCWGESERDCPGYKETKRDA